MDSTEKQKGNCPHNAGLICESRNCTKCGFFPEVHERRIAAIRKYGVKRIPKGEKQNGR